MNAPKSRDPLAVTTSDGTAWVRCAVTRAGGGLYAPEGVSGCPQFVMATLAELAEHGIKGRGPLAEAVAALGALPMPVGPDPLAYGPTGYRCGCGKDAHSNLVPCHPDPVIVDRFDVAMEPAIEEEPVLVVGAVADDGRPVALLLDVETRAKVARWLDPELEKAAPVSPWQRAVDGLNALVDGPGVFHIEPDGHISNPFGDEHIEWDHDTARWRLVHDDDAETVAPHPAPCRHPASPDCLCPPSASLMGRLSEPGVEEALLARIMTVDEGQADAVDTASGKLRTLLAQPTVPPSCTAPHSPSCSCGGDEYLSCGADLGRDKYPFTCARRAAHRGLCSGYRDHEVTS